MRFARLAVVKGVGRHIAVVGREDLGARFARILVVDGAGDDKVIHLLAGSPPVGHIVVAVDFGGFQCGEFAQGGHRQTVGTQFHNDAARQAAVKDDELGSV